MNPQQPQGVHLVGSVPLANAEAVFRAAGGVLGAHLHRIPDGETGKRSIWIVFQIDVLAANPLLEIVPPNPDVYAPLPQVRLREGADPAQLRFDNLGYAEAALASYPTFARLKQEGVVPSHVRFQVSLPTPLAPVSSFVIAADAPKVLPAYTARLLAELDEICAASPHDQLAIQWDVAVAIGILEGIAIGAASGDKQPIYDQLVQLGDRVPADVQMGYHLCYGDFEHKHFMEPRDTGLLVEVANTLSARVQRPINWIHMPVPRNRTDAAYFAPLRQLHLRPETEFYLGLVHFTDGVAGTRARVATAQQVVPEFGIATECGFGRRPPETVIPLMEIHAAVAAPLNQP